MSETIPNTAQEIKLRQQELELATKKLELEQKLAMLNQPTPPTKPTPQIKEPSSGTITKRVASLEIIKHLNNLQKVSIMAVAGSFLTAVGGTFLPIAGGIVAVLVSVGGGFFYIKAKQEIERLATTYNINLKAK